MEKKKKGNPIVRVQLIVIINVLLASTLVYLFTYLLFNNAMMTDIQERAGNLKSYVEKVITDKTFMQFSESDSEETREILAQYRGIASIQHLYIATIGNTGNVEIVMNNVSTDLSAQNYTLNAGMASDIKHCLAIGEVVHSDGIYESAIGSVYVIYWPVFSQSNEVLGAVGMEFDVTTVHESYKNALLISAIIAASLIIMFCLIAYAALHKTQDDYYKKLAYTDILTGLENRVAFEQRLLECEAIIAKRQVVTVMVFDLNNLKKVNDSMGHKLGDLYIRNTANVIAEHLKGHGDVYRIGGDEFAAILVNSPEPQVMTLIDALRRENRQVIKGYQFSCASGVSTFQIGSDNSLQDVIERADNQMYSHKEWMKANGLATAR